MGTALQPGASSKVAADGPFEAVLGKTRRTEFERGKGKPEARSSPPGAPSLLGFSFFSSWSQTAGGRRAGWPQGIAPLGPPGPELLCADSKAATFCANLLALYPALWLFASIVGVEPTNNHVERILRLGVLWRKNAFGCHSAAGRRFVERMLTVVQTLRLQKRPVLDYLYRAIVAHRSGLPAPQLLGQGGD